MSELTVLFFAIMFKYITLCVMVAAAAYLMYHDKSGWGWLIFLALCVGTTSYKYKDDKVEDHEKKTTIDASRT